MEQLFYFVALMGCGLLIYLGWKGWETPGEVAPPVDELDGHLRVTLATLKPCPFCKTSDKLKIRGSVQMRIVWVGCFACGANGPHCDRRLPAEHSKKSAVLQWNNARRPGDEF